MKKQLAIIFIVFISLCSCRKFTWDNPYDTTNPSTEPASLKNGLVAYYPFNGNTNDEAGDRYPGINNGAQLAADRKGNANRAYYFDNNEIISNISNTNFKNDFTISLWVKSDRSQVQYPTILEGADGFLTIQYGSTIPSVSAPVALFYFGYGFSTGLTGGGVLGIVDITKWNFITIRNSNYQTTLFVNGVLIQTNFDSTPNQASTIGSYIKIGNGFQLPQEKFVGFLDDIRIYNRALTQQEITYLANN